MPLTVNVGLNRKASRDFQSAGVSINLSAALDMGLLGDPPRLQHEVAKVYAQASEAIDRQLASMGGQRGSGAGPTLVPRSYLSLPARHPAPACSHRVAGAGP